MAELFREMLLQKSNKTTVCWVENQFDAAYCDNLVEFCRGLNKSEASVVSEKTGVSKDGRASYVAWMPRYEKTLSFYRNLAEIANAANQKNYDFALDGFYEDVQFAEYPEGAGFFKWHLDIGPGIIHRKLTIVVQLSDEQDYEGGELQVMVSEMGIRTAPKSRGTVIIFPSFLLHRVTPVTAGTRKSLVSWISGPAFR